MTPSDSTGGDREKDFAKEKDAREGMSVSEKEKNGESEESEREETQTKEKEKMNDESAKKNDGKKDGELQLKNRGRTRQTKLAPSSYPRPPRSETPKRPAEDSPEADGHSKTGTKKRNCHSASPVSGARSR